MNPTHYGSSCQAVIRFHDALFFLRIITDNHGWFGDKSDLFSYSVCYSIAGKNEF